MDKSNLWVFGDSFSASTNEISKKYCDFKNYTTKNYIDIISNKFNFNVMSFASGGDDNYTIFHKFINKINNIDKNDVLIFGWTDFLRFRIISKEKNFLPICPLELSQIGENQNRKNKILEMDANIFYSKQTLTEILVNRDNDLYINEINDFINIINFSFKNNKIIHWSWMDYKNKLNLSIPFMKLETINDENKDIVDFHYNEESHKILANKIIELL